MRAAVDLNQLAEPRPAGSGLKYPPLSPTLGFVSLKMDLKMTNRLARNRDPVALRQLLRRKRWAKVGVRVPRKMLNLSRHRAGQAVVRRFAALARYQTGVAFLLPGANQPFELAQAHAGLLRRFTLPQPLVHRRTDQVRTRPFRRTHK